VGRAMNKHTVFRILHHSDVTRKHRYFVQHRPEWVPFWSPDGWRTLRNCDRVRPDVLYAWCDVAFFYNWDEANCAIDDYWRENSPRRAPKPGHRVVSTIYKRPLP
jgi:hypothetical protein